MQKSRYLISLVLFSMSSASVMGSQMSRPRITNLHSAAKDGDFEKALSLIKKGRTVDRIDEDGKTPLHYAAAAGHFEMCELLIKYGNSNLLEIPDKDGCIALHYAAFKGHLNICRLLTEQGKSNLVEITDKDGNTALHYAAFQGHFKICELLKRCGASLLATNINNHVPNDCIPDDTDPLYANKNQFIEPAVFDFEFSKKADLENLLRPTTSPQKTLPVLDTCVSSDEESYQVQNIRKPLFVVPKATKDGFWTAHENAVNHAEKYIPKEKN